MSAGKVKLAVFFVVLGAVLYPYLYRYKAGCVFESPPVKKPTLDGKVALITGANTGIGYETAFELARRGCQVILACRDDLRCSRAKTRLETALAQAKVRRTGNLTMLHLDLADLRSVQNASQRVRSEQVRLDYLVLNAGVSLLKLRLTEQGHEMNFGVNHLGHFLLTKLLLPFMKSTASSSGPVRVISVASKAHYWPYEERINLTELASRTPTAFQGFHAYSQSKLANVLHMRELVSRELQTDASTPTGEELQWPPVIAVSLNPGLVATEIFRNFPYYKSFEPFMKYLTYFVAKTPWEGAQTTLHCLLSNSETMFVHNGEYFEDCSPQATSVYAHNINDAKHLWELSEQLVANYTM